MRKLLGAVRIRQEYSSTLFGLVIAGLLPLFAFSIAARAQNAHSTPLSLRPLNLTSADLSTYGSLEMLIQTTSESSPNAIPNTTVDVGDTYPPCSFSTDNPADDQGNPNCLNPLWENFDLTSVYLPTSGLQPATEAVLDDDGNNVLESSNSIDAGYSGAFQSMTASFGCPSSTNSLSGSIVITQQDGSVWTFTIDPSTGQPCNFNQPVTGTFASTGGLSNNDGGNFTLYAYPNSQIAGSYSGVFDNSSPAEPLQQNGSGAAQIDIAINPDFSISLTASLPAGSLGACQTAADTYSTSNALAQGYGFGPGSAYVGYATGGDVLATLADANGNVLGIAGSSTDNMGNFLPAGELFFAANSSSGPCIGYAWDAPFSKKGTPRRGNSPHGKPRRFRHMLHRWRERGLF